MLLFRCQIERCLELLMVAHILAVAAAKDSSDGTIPGKSCQSLNLHIL